MHELPSTGLAFPMQVLQGGFAMHMVHTSIHDASDQTFKGMDLRFAAPAAGLRHGSLLYHGETFRQDCYINNTIFLSLMIFLYQPGVTYVERMTNEDELSRLFDAFLVEGIHTCH
jgi:hypothetical protein